MPHTPPVRTCASCGSPNPDPARFCNACGGRLTAHEATPRRRIVAALFCDLVGSTALAERTDPEVLKRILDGYFGSMRTSIERHGGTVEKFIGDAVVGAFGIPTSHEDDALRAVRAALEMRSAADDLDRELGGRDARIQVRIAIDAGEIFADDGAAISGRVAGDVFNTAARLQSTADVGDVVISAAAERLGRSHIRTEPLAPLTLKGKAEPVDVLRVLGVRETPLPAQTPFVGRSRDVIMLEHALEDAIQGEACVLVTILAPPGVGKSRLAEAFADGVRGRARVLVAQTPSSPPQPTCRSPTPRRSLRPFDEASPTRRTDPPWRIDSLRCSVFMKRSQPTRRGRSAASSKRCPQTNRSS
jgi:class 3 adenylate cyclase